MSIDTDDGSVNWVWQSEANATAFGTGGVVMADDGVSPIVSAIAFGNQFNLTFTYWEVCVCVCVATWRSRRRRCRRCRLLWGIVGAFFLLLLSAFFLVVVQVRDCLPRPLAGEPPAFSEQQHQLQEGFLTQLTGSRFAGQL